jgi:hypothetical protein
MDSTGFRLLLYNSKMHRSETIFALTLCGTLLAGCASPIESMMITADTALITSIGNNAKDKAKVIDASLKEAARVTRAHGYRYFVVLEASDASQMARRIVFTSRVHENKINDTPYGNSSLPPLNNVYGTIPPTGQSVTYYRPGLDITIRMFHPGEVDPAKDGVWNSDTVLSKTASTR